MADLIHHFERGDTENLLSSAAGEQPLALSGTLAKRINENVGIDETIAPVGRPSNGTTDT